MTDEIAAAFVALTQVIDKEAQTRDNIKKITKEIEGQIRQVGQ